MHWIVPIGNIDVPIHYVIYKNKMKAFSAKDVFVAIKMVKGKEKKTFCLETFQKLSSFCGNIILLEIISILVLLFRLKGTLFPENGVFDFTKKKHSFFNFLTVFVSIHIFF